MLGTAWRVATSWYISLLFVVAIGIVIGYFVFFEVFPGKPKIGIIDIPFTVLTEDSVFTIDAFLDYVRERDEIKGVVIRLNSPGSIGSAGEQLFQETRRLREEKPVVIAMGDLVTSGAYMWSLGANHTYANPGSWVGHVGVFIDFPAGFAPLVPRPPDEGVISTGPKKLTFGASRRDFVAMLDQLKENFYQMVVAERGDTLRLSRQQVLEARIYNGNEAVRLGLVDEVGGESEAIRKAAALAGISNYDLVDVNTEVFRIFNEKFMRIVEPLGPLLISAVAERGSVDVPTLVGLPEDTGDTSHPLDGIISGSTIRRFLLPSGIRETEALLSGHSLGINTPRVYYLYVGPSE